MNKIFFDAVDIFLFYYMDDILIYSKTWTEHLEHITTTLKKLSENNLHVKISKCKFGVKEVNFCGMLVSVEGYSIHDIAKETMRAYPMPKSIKTVQQFLGSVRFFHEFIPDLAQLALPLYDLLKKNVTFHWGDEQQTAFNTIITLITSAPTLYFLDPELPTFIKTDASDFAMGGWIGQTKTLENGTAQERIVSYWSQTLKPAERNYPVHERELLGLVSMIQKFQIYLYGIEFDAFTDHRALEVIQTQPNLTPRQMRWVEFLQSFLPNIKYITGPTNTFADWLSRRGDYENLYCQCCNEQFDHRQNYQLKSLNIVSTSFIDLPLLQQEQEDDEFCQTIIKYINSTTTIPSKFTGILKKFHIDADSKILLYQHTCNSPAALVIPQTSLIESLQPLQLLQHFHDNIFTGHQGIQKTFNLMINYVYWSKMETDIKKFINSCKECQKTKANLHIRDGLLHPLPIPDTRFEVIQMDFADMPQDRTGPDHLLVIIDRLTKLVEGIPVYKNITALDTAKVIFEKWFLKGYGLPTAIISDRDKLFTSNTFKEFLNILKITQTLSTARHQQTDGATEIRIRHIKEGLRRCVNYKQDNWVSLLPQVIFSLNNSIHNTTGFTPFYLAHAFSPTIFPRHISTTSTTPLHQIYQSYNTNLDNLRTFYINKQRLQENAYNKSHNIPPIYKIGDLVLLNRDGIEWPADIKRDNKLLPPRLGPFSISDVDTKFDNVTLDLPRYLTKIHPIFHVRNISPYTKPSEFSAARITPDDSNPEPDRNDAGDEFFEVERILDVKKHYNSFMFLVKWVGYDSSQNSWVKLNELGTADERLLEFHQENPDNIAYNSFGPFSGTSPDRTTSAGGGVVLLPSKRPLTVVNASRRSARFQEQTK
jgi:hypothetical protein